MLVHALKSEMFVHIEFWTRNPHLNANYSMEQSWSSRINNTDTPINHHLNTPINRQRSYRQLHFTSPSLLFFLSSSPNGIFKHHCALYQCTLLCTWYTWDCHTMSPMILTKPFESFFKVNPTMPTLLYHVPPPGWWLASGQASLLAGHRRVCVTGE